MTFLRLYRKFVHKKVFELVLVVFYLPLLDQKKASSCTVSREVLPSILGGTRDSLHLIPFYLLHVRIRHMLWDGKPWCRPPICE